MKSKKEKQAKGKEYLKKVAIPQKPITIKGHDFSEKKKVSVWVSQHAYADIADEYFDEKFSNKKTRATNTWSENFKIKYFNPDYMETNGVYGGTVNIKKAAGECSFSTSYIEQVVELAKKRRFEEITWVVLLYDNAYDAAVSGVKKDKYLTFLGVFDYDEAADNLYETK